MIIRYDISILRDDYSRTKTYTRLRLYLTLLSASITKKEIENVRRLLNSSCFSFLSRPYMYDSMK